MQAKETKDLALAVSAIIDVIVKAKTDDGVISISDVKYVPEMVPAIIEAFVGCNDIPVEIQNMIKTMNFADVQEIFGILIPACVKLIGAFK